MALRKGVFTSSVFLTAKLGGVDRYARIGTYHICNGIVPGETFVSSAVPLSNLEKFDRGYRISGNGKWFQLPESRLRINIESLFESGRLVSEVDRRSVNPRIKMETLQLGGNECGFTALIGDITTSDDSKSFGEVAVTLPKFDKSKKKNGGRSGQNGDAKGKSSGNGDPKPSTSRINSNTREKKGKTSTQNHEKKGGTAQIELADPMLNGSPLSVIGAADPVKTQSKEENGLPNIVLPNPKLDTATSDNSVSLEDLILDKRSILRDYRIEKLNLTTMTPETEWPQVAADRIMKIDLKGDRALDYAVVTSDPMRLYRMARNVQPENMDVYVADQLTFILVKG